MAKYFAQRDIQHDGTLIPAGAEMPEGFPPDSLKKLLADGSAGPDAEPGVTKIVREKKKTASSPATDKAAPPAAK